MSHLILMSKSLKRALSLKQILHKKISREIHACDFHMNGIWYPFIISSIKNNFNEIPVSKYHMKLIDGNFM